MESDVAQRQYLAELGALSVHEWKRLFDEARANNRDFTRLNELLAGATPSIEVITDEMFDDKVMTFVGPVLVFFGTATVPTGHQMGVVLERLVQTTKRRVYRMTPKGSEAVRTRFAVPWVPQLYLFRKGKLLGMYRDILRPEKIDEWVRSYTALVYDDRRVSGYTVDDPPT